MSFEFQNFANFAEFAISDIAVCLIGGSDSNGNGIADWVDNRFVSTGAERGTPIHSKVSPFCMRGRSVKLPMASIGGTTLVVNPLPNNGWWSDVALDAGGTVLVHVEYEGGFKVEDLSVVWQAFDVMAESDIVIRKCDSLLLTLDGEGSISVDGNIVVQGVMPSIPYEFAVPGLHSVTGVTAGATNSLTVAVVHCSLEHEHPIWRGRRNSIGFSGNGLDALSVSWDGNATLASTSISDGQCTCTLSVPQFAHPTAFACEIENQDASVAGSAILKPFWAYYTLEGKYYEYERLRDGTRVVENRLSAFDLPDSVEFRMTSSSGICFEDGSGKLSVTPGDFYECGDFMYRFFVPYGVNHPCQFLHGYFRGREFSQ